jgi:hypothetical protein
MAIKGKKERKDILGKLTFFLTKAFSCANERSIFFSIQTVFLEA